MDNRAERRRFQKQAKRDADTLSRAFVDYSYGPVDDPVAVKALRRAIGVMIATVQPAVVNEITQDEYDAFPDPHDILTGGTRYWLAVGVSVDTRLAFCVGALSSDGVSTYDEKLDCIEKMQKRLQVELKRDGWHPFARFLA